MTAANPKAQEPSMEEILASIRRIIADDQDGPRHPGARPVAPIEVPQPGGEPQPQAEEASPATRSVGPAEAEPEPTGASLDGVDSDPIDLDTSDLEEPAAPEPAQAQESKMDLEPDRVDRHDPEPSAEEDRLLSQTTDHSVSHAFNLLTHTVLTRNARTLEDLVTEMLRPMLKEWLDLNLPPLVERLVRAEIERVARGSR
jgi:uncharacterized protein